MVKAKDHILFLLCVFHKMEIILCCFINGKIPKFVFVIMCVFFQDLHYEGELMNMKLDVIKSTKMFGGIDERL